MHSRTNSRLFFVFLLFITLFVSISYQKRLKITKAVATLITNDPNTNIEGFVFFTQDKKFMTRIDIYVKGLKPGFHGLHVHTFGDLSKKCESVGGHYNPYNLTHGSPHDINRHKGDLGNVEASKKGIINYTLYDGLIRLTGPNSIIGRSIVIHANHDDLGKGGSLTSLTNGNSGVRLACGIIGRVNVTSKPNDYLKY